MGKEVVKENKNKKILFLLLGLFAVALSVFLIVKLVGYGGQVIFNPTIPSGCSDIDDLWDSIFKESTTGLVIVTDTSRSNKCDNYLAYKIDTISLSPVHTRSTSYLIDGGTNGESFYCNLGDVAVGAQNQPSTNYRLNKLWCASDNFISANSTKRRVDITTQGGSQYCRANEVVCGGKNHPDYNNRIDEFYCCGSNVNVNLTSKRLVDSGKLLGNLTCSNDEVMCGAKNNPDSNAVLDMIYCCKYSTPASSSFNKIKLLIGEEDLVINETRIIALSGNFSEAAADYLEGIVSSNIPSPENLLSSMLNSNWKIARADVNYNNDFSAVFELAGTNWKTSTSSGETIYSFYENESSASSFKEQEGKVSANFTYIYFDYYKFENSTLTTPISCVQDWVAIVGDCSSNNARTTYYVDNNNCNNITGKPGNISVACNFRGFEGNFSKINASFSVSFFINNTPGNNSKDYSTIGLQRVQIKSGADVVVEFYWNFSKETLNLNEIYIERQNSSASRGYLLIKGIETPKKIFVDRLTSSSKICVRNAQINSINAITSNCIRSYEYLLDCPDVNSGISCDLSEDFFEIEGLTHSGVIEITDSSTSPTSCLQNWSCSSWSSCVNNQQTRTCTDTRNCNNNTGKPAITQSCTSTSTGCFEDWDCTDWGDCTEGEQTRTCTDNNDCGTTNTQPEETKSCSEESSGGILIWLIVFILLILIAVIAIIFVKIIKKRKTINQPAVRPSSNIVVRR